MAILKTTEISVNLEGGLRFPKPRRVNIRYIVERFTDLPVDRYITITEGTGKWK